MADAKVVISVKDGVFEFSGPTEFVEKQLEHYRDSIAKAMAGPKHHTVASDERKGDESGSGSGGSAGATVPDGLDDLVTVDDDGKIHIMADINGAKAAKQIKLALLAGLIKPVGVPFAELHEICRDHACFDSGNFAKTMKAEKELFLVTGKGRGQMSKLTRTGIKKANELAAQLRASS